MRWTKLIIYMFTARRRWIYFEAPAARHRILFTICFTSCTRPRMLPCRSPFHFYSFRQVVHYNLQNNNTVNRVVHRHSVARMQNSSLIRFVASTMAAAGVSVFLIAKRISLISSENELKIFHGVCKVAAKKSPRKPSIRHSDRSGYWNAN